MENEKKDQDLKNITSMWTDISIKQDLKNITSMWTDISIKHAMDAKGDVCCFLIYAENTKGNYIPTVCRNGEELINEIKKILLLIKD